MRVNNYNDIVTFETNKKDDASRKAFRRFLIFGFVVIALLVVLVVFIIGIVNKSVDTSLSSLSVDQGIISPEFKSSTTNYTIETDADNIFFTCAKASKKTKVSGCGKTISLDEDENHIKIVVSFKEKKTTYNFTVLKNTKFNMEVSKSMEDWTDQDIILSVSASSLEGFDLDNEAYSFDDGETWQKENTKSFDKNQTVKIRVRDVKGNISSALKVKINKIDKNIPKVKVSVKKKKLTATVAPNKTPSGYTYTWYKDNKEIKNSNKVTYTASSNGKYKVKVTNGVGKTVLSEEVSITSGTTYTVSYDANGGSDAPSDGIKEKNKAYSITNAIPSRSGYQFMGWSVSKNGEVDYKALDTYNIDKSIVLYAVWEKSSTETYTIKYDAMGGSNAPSVQVKEKDKALTLSNTIPTKANSEFLGWATVSGGNVVYKNGATYNENKSITLYAVWQNMKTITVNYVSNGASIEKSQVSSSGSNTFTLPNITRSGYQILGWATSQTATQATYKVGQKVTFNESITLYAITTKKVTATFNKNTASSISKTTASCNLYNRGTLCTVTTPTITPKNGKKALGWSMTPNSSNASFAQNTKIAISSNTTLYAITK